MSRHEMGGCGDILVSKTRDNEVDFDVRAAPLVCEARDLDEYG